MSTPTRNLTYRSFLVTISFIKLIIPTPPDTLCVGTIVWLGSREDFPNAGSRVLRCPVRRIGRELDQFSACSSDPSARRCLERLDPAERIRLLDGNEDR